MATTIYMVLNTGPLTPNRNQWETVLSNAMDGAMIRAMRVAAKAAGNIILKPLDRKFDATLQNLGFGVKISDEFTRDDIGPAERQALKTLYLAAGGVLDKDTVDELTIRDVLLTILDDEASKRSIAGTFINKFRNVIPAELREAAVRAGFTPAQANNLTVSQVFVDQPNADPPVDAGEAFRTWLATNWNYPVV